MSTLTAENLHAYVSLLERENVARINGYYEVRASPESIRSLLGSLPPTSIVTRDLPTVRPMLHGEKVVAIVDGCIIIEVPPCCTPDRSDEWSISYWATVDGGGDPGTGGVERPEETMDKSIEIEVNLPPGRSVVFLEIPKDRPGTRSNPIHIPACVSRDGRPESPDWYPPTWAKPSPAEQEWMYGNAPSFEGRAIDDEVEFVASDGKTMTHTYPDSIEEETKSTCKCLTRVVEESNLIAKWMGETPAFEIGSDYNKPKLRWHSRELPFDHDEFHGFVPFRCDTDDRLVEAFLFLRNEMAMIEAELSDLRRRLSTSTPRTETASVSGAVTFREGDCESSDTASIDGIDVAGMLQKRHGHHVELTIVDHGPVKL